MPVFLSHKREDTEVAVRIGRYLTSNGVVCYIDVLDPTLKTTDDITDTIISRLKMCSHMMAVVSQYTERSWWVPFETGVATETEKRISSYDVGATNLPEFLSKWPILKSQRDLDLFIQFYRRDTQVPSGEKRASVPTHSEIRSAQQFHRELKASL